MRIGTRRTAWLGAALVAMAIAAPIANAAPREVSTPHSLTALGSAPPRLHRQVSWFHRRRAARSLQARAAQFGSTAVIGLETMRDLQPLRERYGFDHVVLIPELHAAEVRVDRAQVHALLAHELTDPRIRYVSPPGPSRRPMSMPDDPLVRTIDPLTSLPYEWQFAASRVDRALDLSVGDPTIEVGVIDTRVANVPDLAGKVDGLWSVADDGVLTEQPVAAGNDDYGHGTAVASLIAADVNDGFGMAGFGGATHVIAVHAGNLASFPDASIAIALTKLVSLGVRIVNMSIEESVPSDPLLVDAIHNAAAAGVLLVAAAGNLNGPVMWPAADLQPSGGGRSFGLAVGATDFDDKLAYFSSSGKHLSLVAPGNTAGLCSGVLVALPPGNAFHEDYPCYPEWSGAGGATYGYIAGTSFSAPEVAGVAALIWAARPQLKNYQVADIIKQSARRSAETWTPTMGCGLLDAGAALELATSRSAAAWAEPNRAEAAACSTGGDEPPAWPDEPNQTITFDPIGDKKVGDPDFRVNATASSGLPVPFASSGSCTMRDATVHITGAGTCTITASQAGDTTYNPARNVWQTFSIAKADTIAAPAVVALSARGSWGASVKLPFRVGEPGDASVTIRVQKNRSTVARLALRFSGAEPGQVHAAAWRAPSAKTRGNFRFCVTLTDHARNASTPSCARIRLR